jgi:outer membrane lipoprotein carrier protein
MAGSLACILSYGLLCTPTEVEVIEAPPATPLSPVEDSTTQGEDGSAKPPAGSASAVLAKVQSFYDGTNNLRAKFKQTYTNAVYGTKKVSRGNLKVAKPGKMVWDYGDAKAADFWVDGKRIWVVESATKQVIRKDVGNSDIAGAEQFLFGGQKLVSNFLVKLANETLEKRYGRAGHTVIRLKPKKKNPHYKELLLVVDDTSGRVDSFAVLNQDKSVNFFELSGLDRNGSLKAADLTFRKPSGYKLIEG